MAFTTGFWTAGLEGTVTRMNQCVLGYGPKTDFPAAAATNKGMLALATDEGRVYYSDGSSWVVLLPEQARAVKASDETVNNNTFQDDDDLNFAVAANDVWHFKLVLLYSTTPTPDIKFTFTVPAAGAIRFITSGDVGGSTIGTGGIAMAWTAATIAIIQPHSVSTGIVIVEGIYIGGANAGTVQLQWAQNVTDAGDTKVLTGSSLLAWKMN